ncbi:MAG: hypothetical protein WJ306_03235 [Ferrovum myxofaciens]
MLKNGQTEGWYLGDRWMVLVLWMLPVVGRLLVGVTNVQIRHLHLVVRHGHDLAAHYLA